MNSISRFLIALFLLQFGFPSLLQAQQQVSKQSKMVEIVDQSLSAFCPLMMKNMAQQISKQAPFIEEGKLVNPVCECAKNAIHADPRIREAFSLPNEELQSKLVSSQFKTYLFSRISSSFYLCLGTYLKEQTDSANLEF